LAGTAEKARQSSTLLMGDRGTSASFEARSAPRSYPTVLFTQTGNRRVRKVVTVQRFDSAKTLCGPRWRAPIAVHQSDAM